MKTWRLELFARVENQRFFDRNGKAGRIIGNNYDISSSKYHAPSAVELSVKEKKLPQCNNRTGTEVRFKASFSDQIEKSTWTVKTPIGSIVSSGELTAGADGLGFSYSPQKKVIKGTGSRAKANLYFVLCCQAGDKDYEVVQPHKQTLSGTGNFQEIYFTGSKQVRGSSR